MLNIYLFIDNDHQRGTPNSTNESFNMLDPQVKWWENPTKDPKNVPFGDFGSTYIVNIRT